MNNDLLYQIALTQVPFIGPVHARTLLGIYGDAKSIFQSPRHHLEKIEGIGTVKARGIKHFDNFSRCEQEIKFIEKNGITVLYHEDPAYPYRLRNCADGPVLLYFKGNADLNPLKVIAVVGTRNFTEYGRQACIDFIEKLDADILVISGLAYGIDTLAHRSALKNQLATVGVLAHGLNRIYPPENRSLARQMISSGGLLTEFISHTDPDRENFPRRNRIVAGICDAVIVIESGKKGGSIITAELANSYNRDVFAIPGRISDHKSDGCNNLIRQNKAALLTDTDYFLEAMNWKPLKSGKVKQKELFVSLSEQEQSIVDLLRQDAQHIDRISQSCELAAGEVATALLSLEMQGIVISLPGKIYRLN